MEKPAKGFTLIELMIVVAIIGILAAIAIPNFLRYQLRAKFAELRTNVEAIVKSENTLRMNERVLCVGAPTGYFASIGPIPAAAPTAQKTVWADADVALASAIDWVVQGGTYGQYKAATNLPDANAATCAAPVIGAFGLGLAVNAISDIDGDGVFANVGAWQPQRSAAGVATAAPNLPLAGNTAVCGGRTQPATIGDSQATTCSSDNIF